MNEEEINKIQILLNERTIFMNYETHKNIYHYLHNHLYHTRYIFDPLDFKPPLYFRYLYKDMIDQKCKR